MSDASATPMMKQYLAIRRELPEDVLLFFRLGDFYELFFEDAKTAAPLLNVSLTKRNGVPMCGVPHHASQGYIAKLIRAGKRVAIAEQTTDPVPGKIVERAVSQILSAGTVNDLNLLESNRSNYLAAVFRTAKKLGLAYVDLTTGEFEVAEFKEAVDLVDELERIQASELLHSEEQRDLIESLGSPACALAVEGYLFLEDQADHALTQHFKVKSLDGFGCQGLTAALCAAGCILQYLQFQLRRNVDHIQRLRVAQTSDFVLIDAASQSHLELVTARGGAQHTLLSALDRTCTPMGGRKLRHWVLHPLRDLEQLTQRQDMVATLLSESLLLGQLRTLLKEVRDLERTSSRLSQGSGNGRDLLAMAASLEVVPSLKMAMEQARLLYGRRPAPLIQLQLESLKQRLRYAAETEAAERAAGWEIYAAEWQPSLEKPLLIEGARLTCKVDRIDRHAHSGHLRVLDFKTADKLTLPMLAHVRKITGRSQVREEDEWKCFILKDGTRYQWKDLQLPLYAAVLSEQGLRPDSVGYFALPKSVQDTKVALWEGFSDEWVEHALACAAEVVRRLRDGVFWPPASKAYRRSFDELFLNDFSGSTEWAEAPAEMTSPQ
ncbi:MAG TPA: hypothetical protein DCP71_01195 [Verrucomicrobiales bacterium]|nr:hypothetical protein [Verrucomicrobiales bacterium]